MDQFEPQHIWEVSHTAFLVYDPMFEKLGEDHEFYLWLDAEGFTDVSESMSTDFNPCIYINITNKLYTPGICGVCVCPPVGHHAITIDEFMTIYNIFKKYNGKHPLEFDKDQFKKDKLPEPEAESVKTEDRPKHFFPTLVIEDGVDY